MMPSFQLKRELVRKHSRAKDSQRIVLHYFVDPKLVGEHNHALGMLAALQKQDSTVASKHWLITEYDDFLASLKKNLIEMDDSEDDTPIQNVVLGIGQSGFEIFTKFCSDESNVKQQCYTVWSGHEIVKGLETLLGKINTIALPKHETQDKSAKEFLDNADTNLIQMNGVPHNTTLESISDALTKWKGKGIPNDKPCICVILGGDVPDPILKQRCFTPEESALFATWIAKLAKELGFPVLLTNGPRTGKYDPKTKEDLKLHQEDSTLDQTTAAFEKILRAEKVDCLLQNFIYGKDSAYKPFLATAAQNKDSVVFVTADSISQVCEVQAVLPHSKINLVQVSSMKDSYICHMNLVLQNTQIRGYAIDLDKQNVTEISSKKEAEASTSAGAGAGAGATGGSTGAQDNPTDYKTAAEILSSGIREGLQSLNAKRSKVSRKLS